jgi:hypothetical protein
MILKCHFSIHQRVTVSEMLVKRSYAVVKRAYAVTVSDPHSAQSVPLSY